MDAYGKMLIEGKDKDSFNVERDDGHTTDYSFKEWLGKTPNIAKWEDKIFHQLIKGSVLDIGCGTGKHVSLLQDLGFKTKGIDASEGAIEIGKGYGRNLDIGNFWELDEDKKYDNIIIMDSTIGFIAAPNQIDDFFKKVKNLLPISGRLALTSINWAEATDETYKKYIQNNKKENRYPGRVKLRFKTDSFTGNWFEGYYYDRNSLISKAIAHGFYPRRIGYENIIKYCVVFELEHPEKLSL